MGFRKASARDYDKRNFVGIDAVVPRGRIQKGGVRLIRSAWRLLREWGAICVDTHLCVEKDNATAQSQQGGVAVEIPAATVRGGM